MAKITHEGVKFVRHMVDEYGVVSCFDNVDEEENPLEAEGLWFECPCCDESILLYDDWGLDEAKEVCPICECRYDEG